MATKGEQLIFLSGYTVLMLLRIQSRFTAPYGGLSNSYHIMKSLSTTILKTLKKV